MADKLYADHYVQTLSQETRRQFAFQANNKADLQAWQQAFRQSLGEALGLDEIQKRPSAPLDPTCLETIELDDHIREEWRITSEPGYRVPFFLLRPKDQVRPTPLVLTPHGHGKHGKKTYVGLAETEEEQIPIREGERDIALQAVRAGYTAIAPDVRAFGETRFKSDIEADKGSSCSILQLHALLFGRTLIGERVWDIMRLIDYAEDRDDIDTSRIIITGNSGGGTVSLFAGAMEERISIVIPGSYFCTFTGSIGSIRHCACNYVPGMMTMGEMYDAAGLIAPRPFLAVNGREDRIFPIAETEKAFEKLKAIYTVAGVPERCELYIGSGGHRYYKERVWPFVAAWLEQLALEQKTQ